MRVGSSLSKKAWVQSGITQDSVMGSIFFLIYIASMGENLDDKANLLKYVDDTKYYGKITNEQDLCDYQDCLNSIYSWAECNSMVWNSLKFQLLRFGPDTSLKESTLIFSPNYSKVICESENVRDLGVLVDSDLDYKA